MPTSRARAPLSLFVLLATLAPTPGYGQAARTVVPSAAAPGAAPVAMAAEAQAAIEGAHEAARDAARAAHEAASAAQAAAEAARVTAKSVQTLANHVEDIEHPEPSDGKLPEWAYHLSLSALANAGNSSTFAGKLSSGIDGNWHSWGTEFRLAGAYGATDPPGVPPAEVTAFNGLVTARGSHNYTAYIGNYVFGGATFDRVASIRYQAFGELGITIIWWEVERHGYVKSRLRTSLGVRVMHEERHQYYPTPQRLPTRLLYGPPVTVNYRYAINRNVYISEDADLLYNIADAHDIRLNSTTALVASMTDAISLQVAAKYRYIGVPSQGKTPRDLELSTGLTFNF